MITVNVIYRVFNLSSIKIGTCFTLEVDNRQYFITAKHVVEGLVSGDTIRLFHENQWKEFSATLIGHSLLADVSVFSLPIEIPAHPAPPTYDGITYGQDLYFLGFPSGHQIDVGALNRGFPMPLVKKGVLASMPTLTEPVQFLIDGHNNLGFSGGPVIFKKSGSQGFNIAGVISGFYKERDETDEFLENTNSGIIQAFGIKNALDLIAANPIGTTIQFA